jgi:predicted nucleotidyltransferase
MKAGTQMQVSEILVSKKRAEKPKEVEEYLEKVVEKLKSTVSPYKIVLFGSYAKGEAKPDSDIDLMVILDNDYIPKDSPERSERNLNVLKLVRDIHYDYGMDFKIYSKAEFKRLKDKGSFFIGEVEKTGETIYEKWN